MSWKPINKPYRDYQLNVGTIVRVAYPHNNEQEDLVVGDVNDMGGVCDDCSGITSGAIIVAEFDLSDVIEAAKATR